MPNKYTTTAYAHQQLPKSCPRKKNTKRGVCKTETPRYASERRREKHKRITTGIRKMLLDINKTNRKPKEHKKTTQTDARRTTANAKCESGSTREAGRTLRRTQKPHSRHADNSVTYFKCGHKNASHDWSVEKM